MSALSAQTRHVLRLDKFLPDHLVFKRFFPAPTASTPSPGGFAATTFAALPPIQMTSGHPLGFFCKEELVIQRTLRLPIFFRLGSLEYCNRMEGK